MIVATSSSTIHNKKSSQRMRLRLANITSSRLSLTFYSRNSNEPQMSSFL
ncbi:unnamed protein product [Oikopleura dioica]|uniref:Uncharacterized protein n=1 Tax=Oikopleura dioica TaxID=34765 RepID=E4X0F4_OIKDI|nr:unnamed protein product [Oikopleura dioica]